MMVVSVTYANCSGLLYRSNPLMPYKSNEFHVLRSDYSNWVPLKLRPVCRNTMEYCCVRNLRTKHFMYASRSHNQLTFDEDLPPEPIWVSLTKDVIWGLRSLIIFLVEQPSQLKYIEWPGFRSTLKTAILTLVLVGLLIVALSSIDAALSYLLALFLRRI